MESPDSTAKFLRLGKRLKALRTTSGESLAEASGAVEIDVRQLASIELGQARPSEDVLLLLISHFGAEDDEAVRLWEMAGYGIAKASAVHLGSDNTPSQPSDDSRVLFTDVVDVMVNNYGVVMNFAQSGGPASQPTTVARVGMSREHAKSVLDILKVTLAQTERPVNKKLATPADPTENTI